MAKANANLPDGTRIVIEGSADEVAKIVSLVQGISDQHPAQKPATRPAKKTKPGIKGYVRELKAEGFFKENRLLADVKKALDARGQIYKTTSLSGAMLELVRHKELGRVKGSRNKWMYIYKK